MYSLNIEEATEKAKCLATEWGLEGWEPGHYCFNSRLGHATPTLKKQGVTLWYHDAGEWSASHESKGGYLKRRESPGLALAKLWQSLGSDAKAAADRADHVGQMLPEIMGCLKRAREVCDESKAD